VFTGKSSTQSRSPAKTGAGGEYVITDLSAGNYDVTIKQHSFKRCAKSYIPL
jgi:hypothetical protein